MIESKENRKGLYYNTSAKNWNEALPIGNGFIGGMVYGKTDTEIISLNEDSIWYGGKQARNNLESVLQLEKIRKLILKDQLKEAEDLILPSMAGIPDNQRHYDVAGNLEIKFNHRAVKNYRRQLDLETAINTVEYRNNNIDYKRKTFVSYPDNVLCNILSTKHPKALSFRCRLTRGRGMVDKISWDDKQNMLFLKASTTSDGIEFVIGMTVVTDGTIDRIGEFLEVKNATNATIMVGISTSYRVKDYFSSCLEHLMSVKNKSVDKIQIDHVRDYQKLFRRVQFKLEIPEYHLSIPEIQEKVAKGDSECTNLLTEVLFNYGRYLLIASSRKGSLPANLQGIWNADFLPAWDSKYTLNINTEMNYWIAEKGNLSECHEPLFDHLSKIYENGQITASVMYNARGFVCHHNTDNWGDTAPQSYSLSSTIWPMGAAWLVLHVYEHYCFTLDKKFLKDNFYLIEESVLFFIDYLVELPSGEMVTIPSSSPENSYYIKGEKHTISYGPAMDNQILIDLFKAYISAGQILGSMKYEEEVERIIAKIPKIKIGRYGQIQEWYKDYIEVDLGHRHLSPLYALFPSNQISDKTPKLLAAAKRTLKRRLDNGGGYTGWSCAWIINLWARLSNGPEAYTNIVKMLNNSLLPNLLDNHPPFQIDGNFGFTSGVIEMIVQKNDSVISVLSALPDEWCNGELLGIKLPGDQELDIIWENNDLKYLKISGQCDNIYEIRNKNCQILNGLDINQQFTINREKQKIVIKKVSN